MTKGPRAISMGGGVQTTAILIRYWERYEYVIFADLGDEMPETYYYINTYLKPFAKEKGLKWIDCRHKSGLTLWEFDMKEKTVPTRWHRECTVKHKIYPIRRVMRKLGATVNNPGKMAIGFSLDESQRLGSGKHEVKYIEKEYPLLDDKITRQGCKDIITDHGWELPIKSGCYYCPFKRKQEIRELATAYPELYQKAVMLEQNDAAYPKNLPYGIPLDELIKQPRSKREGLTELEMCDTGHCMT